MKRFIFILSLAVLLSATACGNTGVEVGTESNSTLTVEEAKSRVKLEKNQRITSCEFVEDFRFQKQLWDVYKIKVENRTNPLDGDIWHIDVYTGEVIYKEPLAIS